jgi:hypothetical protein
MRTLTAKPLGPIGASILASAGIHFPALSLFAGSDL